MSIFTQQTDVRIYNQEEIIFNNFIRENIESCII